MKPVEYFGIGSRSKLKDILTQIKPRSIFLVTGKNSFDILNKKYRLVDLFRGRKTVRFYDFENNPKLKDIKRGIQLYKKHKPDLVIAIGGGSVIDTAKAINSLAHQGKEPKLYVKGEARIKNKDKPFVALPTTSGTGSESTHFAVVYIGETKYSLTHPYVLPDYAIVDPELTFNLPASITASTGLDALCQAIESYWSNKSTMESKEYAREAIDLLLKFLPESVNKSTKKSRIAVARGAHLAGKAINISFTTASHAISYPITSYFGVPHGHAVALTVPSLIVFNSSVTGKDLQDERGVAYVRKTMRELISLLGTNTPQKAKQRMESLMRFISTTTKLSELGVKTQDDINIIVDNGFNPGRVKNNPRQITRGQLEIMLKKLL